MQSGQASLQPGLIDFNRKNIAAWPILYASLSLRVKPMFLAETHSGDLVEVLDLSNLANPFEDCVKVQYQRGEDLADPEIVSKRELSFPSGEPLPQCWLDSHYRDLKIFSRFRHSGRV
jgi:hypothetical protein